MLDEGLEILCARSDETTCVLHVQLTQRSVYAEKKWYRVTCVAHLPPHQCCVQRFRGAQPCGGPHEEQTEEHTRVRQHAAGAAGRHVNLHGICTPLWASLREIDMEIRNLRGKSTWISEISEENRHGNQKSLREIGMPGAIRSGHAFPSERRILTHCECDAQCVRYLFHVQEISPPKTVCNFTDNIRYCPNILHR